MEIAVRDATVAAAGGSDLFADLRMLKAGAIEIEVAADMTTPHVKRKDGSSLNCGSDSGALELRQRLNDEGIHAAALLIATNFSGDDAAAHATWTARACAAAEALGAPVVRIDPLNLDKSLAADDVRNRFLKGIRAALREMGRSTVELGIENHGPFANDPAWLDVVLEELGEARVGLTLDTGNFYWFGFPLNEMYALIEKYAPLAKHTHLKNINFPPDDANRRREIGFEYKQYCSPLHEGNLDLRRIVTILKNAGYDRTLCIEDESLFKIPAEMKLQILRREVEALKRAML